MQPSPCLRAALGAPENSKAKSPITLLVFLKMLYDSTMLSGLHKLKVVIFCMITLFTHGLLHAANSYSVGSGVSLEITEHGVCKDVYNILANSLFVPTRTAPEWTAFYNNPPAGVAVSACADGWYNTNWGYRVKVIFSPSQVSTTLAGFPALITETHLPASFFTNVKADGSDIVVTEDDGLTKLNRDLERIDTGASQMELWVKVPSLDDTTPTIVYIYYGYASATETNDATTWSAYRNVYHMTSLTPADAAATTTTTGSSGGTLVAAKIGQGASYNGNGRINFSSVITSANFKSVSLWYYPRSKGGGNYGSVFGSNGYPNGMRHVDTNSINIRRNSAIAVSSSSTFNVWKHLVFVFDSGTGNVTLYENGVAGTPSTLSGGWYSLYHLVGISNATNRAPDGIVDEMRVSNAVIDASWISTEYNNQNSPSTFYSAGSEVAKP